MKSFIFFLIQVIVCSGIFYGYYHLALRNRKFHLYNRYYLLATVILSIVIPLVHVPVYLTSSEKQSALLETLSILAHPNVSNETPLASVTISETPIHSFQNIFFTLYLVVAMLVLVRFVAAIFQIRKIISKYIAERIDHFYFINTDEQGTPFSFFKWLFWNNKIELNSEEGQQVFRHELFHIQQKHSWDAVFMDICLVIFWINPFLHLTKRELKTIHEFLADEFATSENDKWDYAELLLTRVLNTHPNHLTNPFFYNQIKRRIAMITSSKKTSHQYLRKIMVIPVIALVSLLFAFKINSYSDNVKDSAVRLTSGDMIGQKTDVSVAYVHHSDTTKPTGKKQKLKDEQFNSNSKEQKSQLEAQQKEAEKATKAREELKQLEAKQKESEKAGEEFKKLMELKQLEAEKAGIEFKQMMAMKQFEAEKARD